ncbi:hypothetical protein CF133_17660 [Aeromonas salmonicida]|nr:hypothetical protein CF133_17660 [Aeromonas salmonicida]
MGALSVDCDSSRESISRIRHLLYPPPYTRNHHNSGEVMAYVSAMNKLNTLGLPVRKPRL